MDRVLGHPLLADILAQFSAIEELKDNIERHRDIASAIATEWLLETPEEGRLEVAKFLYWNMPQITVASIASGLDDPPLRVNEVALRMGKYPISQCENCGDFVYAISRADRALRKGYGGPELCKECQEQQRLDFVTRGQRRQERRTELATMPYNEYLATPEWDMTRKKAMRRERFTCQFCGEKGVELNVHHANYERRGREKATDLLVLCKPCHERQHGIIQEQ
jgi:hypothetical protein